MKKLFLLWFMLSAFVTACGFDAETTSTKLKSVVTQPTTKLQTTKKSTRRETLCNSRQETAADYQTCGDRCAARNGGDRSYILCEYAWNSFSRQCELRASCGSLPEPR